VTLDALATYAATLGRIPVLYLAPDQQWRVRWDETGAPWHEDSAGRSTCPGGGAEVVPFRKRLTGAVTGQRGYDIDCHSTGGGNDAA